MAKTIIRVNSENILDLDIDTRNHTLSGNIIDEVNNTLYPVGGGGGGDWTTAQVTIRPTIYTDKYDLVSTYSTSVPVLYEGSYEALTSVSADNDIIVEVPLYKGEAVFIADKFIDDAVLEAEVEPGVFQPDITGTYTFDPDTYLLTVTGDISVGVGIIK